LPITVEIQCMNDRTYSITLSERKGDVKRPLSEEELCRKFSNCVEYLGHPALEKHKNSIQEIVLNLELIENLDELIQKL
jgi:hypothetical protein